MYCCSSRATKNLSMTTFSSTEDREKNSSETRKSWIAQHHAGNGFELVETKIYIPDQKIAQTMTSFEKIIGFCGLIATTQMKTGWFLQFNNLTPSCIFLMTLKSF